MGGPQGEAAGVSVSASESHPAALETGLQRERPASTLVPQPVPTAFSFPHSPQLCPTPAAQEGPLRASSALPAPVPFVKPTR